MNPHRWAVLGFDLETTGLDAVSDRIVQAGLVLREANGEESTWDWLINPGVPIPVAATQIHGITTERVRSVGANPKLALAEIADLIVSTLKRGVPLLIHNAHFDLQFLRAELLRHGLPTLESRLPNKSVRPVIDTQVLDRAVVDRYASGPRTLSGLLEKYQLGAPAQLHDAVVDIKAAIAVFDAILAAHPDQASVTATELHDIQQRSWLEYANWVNQHRGPHDPNRHEPRWP